MHQISRIRTFARIATAIEIWIKLLSYKELGRLRTSHQQFEMQQARELIFF